MPTKPTFESSRMTMLLEQSLSQIFIYFWFYHYLPNGDLSATCFNTFHPTISPIMTQTIVPTKTGFIQINNYKFYIISERFQFYQNKKKQGKYKYNKFCMENIEAKATYQLLNLQDEDQPVFYEPFNMLIPNTKQKSKGKLTARQLASRSSHKDIQSVQNQNHKQILKLNLKKLLQKQNQSPKHAVKRVKTFGCSQSSKVFQIVKKFTRKNSSSQKPTSQLLDYKKNCFRFQQKQNNSSSQSHKQFDPLQKQISTASIFQEENQKIRILIKKRISQKSEQKMFKKNIQQASQNENIQKIKTLLMQKNIFLTKNQESFAQLKMKNQQKSTSRNIFDRIKQQSTKNLISWGKKQSSKDKQNVKCVTAMSTPNATAILYKKKQSLYQTRKLKNIIF